VGALRRRGAARAARAREEREARRALLDVFPEIRAAWPPPALAAAAGAAAGA
jgi:hypothetical protein